jgi:hypothetical protein
VWESFVILCLGFQVLNNFAYDPSDRVSLAGLQTARSVPETWGFTPNRIIFWTFILQGNFVTKSWPVTAPGSQGVFRGRGRGFGFLKNGRQAAIVLSWLLLVQLPGQVLRSYSSKVSKSKRFLIVKQILVYSVTAKLSTEQYLVVWYWFTRMR